jgi:hypothetical protein
MNKKPSIFVSSTIRDFRDLRGALKYYLEELGYAVLLSEYNDFPKPLDKSAYEACLKAVGQADYYILLIGEEVGSLWSAAEGISVTRMEYREAYSLAQEDRIRMLLFVRRCVWEARSRWKCMATAMTTCHGQEQMDEALSQQIGGCIAPSIKDPEHVFSFLDEVARAEETEEAARAGTPFPESNWVHCFESFRDLADALRVHLGISGSLQEAIMRTSLRREILVNLSLLLQKGKHRVFPTYTWATSAQEAFAGGLEGATTMTTAHLRQVIQYTLFGGRGVTMLRTRILDRALETGFGLEYDRRTSELNYTRLSERLFQLRESLGRLQMLRNSNTDKLMGFVTTYLEQSKLSGTTSVQNADLIYALTVAGEEENSVRLLQGVYLAMEGDDSVLEDVVLNPPTPLRAEQEQVAWEEVSLNETTGWLHPTAHQNAS